MYRILMILLGNTIYALGVVLFIVPNGLVTGGTTGLGLAALHFFNIPLPLFVTVFNLLMFGIGYWVLGKTFALSTLLSTIFYPMALAVRSSSRIFPYLPYHRYNSSLLWRLLPPASG